MSERNIRGLVESSLKRRYRAEHRFRYYGIGAVATAFLFLALLFASIFSEGVSAFRQTAIALEITFDADALGVAAEPSAGWHQTADFQGLVKSSLRTRFPEVTKRREKRELYRLMSSGAGFELRPLAADEPAILGTSRRIWLTASDDVDMLVKGRTRRDQPASVRRVSDRQLAWLEALEEEGALKTRFNWTFLTGGDSREPELAGILAALVGSLLSLAVCFALSFPLGVLTAVYLEEFAPKNRWTDLIEINVNNLAAVPSIVFGLLGLAFFLNVAGLPRSAPLVGGMVLALMTLPTIIIASRAVIKAVPPSLREAAMALGASPVQTAFHHVVPAALPGMLTGTIIGMARALGETAPLLMIGMVAFIVDVPRGLLDPATALPVQIFLWADSPERAFLERASAAIMVLLAFLVCMNLVAVILRQRFEQRW
jgi:phosphate transport system permease protein